MDAMGDQADDILNMNPAHPLMAAAYFAAESEAVRQLHQWKCTAFAVQYETNAQLD